MPISQLLKQGSHRPQTPKISPVRPSACNWYYCAQFIAPVAHKNVREDRTCSSEDTIADKHTQTDRLAHNNTSRSSVGSGVTTKTNCYSSGSDWPHSLRTTARTFVNLFGHLRGGALYRRYVAYPTPPGPWTRPVFSFARRNQ